MSNYDSGFDRAQRAHDNATPEGVLPPPDLPNEDDACDCGHSADNHEVTGGGWGTGPCDDECGCRGFVWPEDDDGPDPDDARDRAYDAQMVD